ncbi:MAG: hypothetical protein IJF31_03190 [Clostridia bacterium]|nr:hypothetical protein [Clostridia bacterium]
MRLPINENDLTFRPKERRTQAKTLQLIRDAGFDTVDFGLFTLGKHPDEGEGSVVLKKHSRNMLRYKMGS